MKVIGKTADGFICEVKEYELDAILGLNDTRKSKVKTEISAGAEITFDIALRNLDLLKDLKLTSSYGALTKLREAQSSLKSIIDVVEKTDLELLKVQERIKKSQV